MGKRLRFQPGICLILAFLSLSCSQGRLDLFPYFSDRLAPPVPSAEAGSYSTPITLWLSNGDSRDGVTLFYTTDPNLGYADRDSWTSFQGDQGGIRLEADADLRTFAYRSDTDFSDIQTYAYRFICQEPGFSPDPGTYDFNREIFLHAQWVPGLRVVYTLDGSDPLTSAASREWFPTSPPIRLAPFDPADPADPLKNSRRIRAATLRPGWAPSAVAEGYYRLRQSSSPTTLGMSFGLGMAGGGSLSLTQDDGSPVLDPSIANLNVYAILSMPNTGFFSWYIDGALVQSGAQSSLNIGSSGPAGALAEGVHELICGFQGGGGTSSIAYASTLVLSRADPASLAVFRVRSVSGSALQFYGNGFSLSQGIDTLEIETRVPDTGTLSYAWSLNGSAISGATAATIQVGALGPAGLLSAGSYDLSCRVTSSSGASYAGSLSLAVKSAPLAPSASPSSSVGITLTANLPSGEAALTPTGTIILPVSTWISVNASFTSTPDGYRWYIDTVDCGNLGSSINVGWMNPPAVGGSLAIGSHEVTCVIHSGSFYYSDSLFFYVVP